MDLPESFFLPLTLDDTQLHDQILDLPPAVKAQHLKALESLTDQLLATVLPKAVMRQNLSFKLSVKPTSSLSCTEEPEGHGYTTYGYASSVLVDVWLNVASNGLNPRNECIWDHICQLNDTQLSEPDFQIIAYYAFLRAFFGPDPITLRVCVPQFITPATPLCEFCQLTEAAVRFKAHETIEDLLADLTFEGITI